MSVTKKEFEIEAGKQIEAGSVRVVSSDAPLLSGYLVCVGDEWAVVDQEFEYVSCFPSFVKTTSDAESFLSCCEHYFSRGVASGATNFKGQLATFLGFATQGYVDNATRSLGEAIDTIAEKRNP